VKAELASVRGDPTAAIDELHLALVYDPDSIYLTFELAGANLAAGRLEKAGGLADRVLERRPSHVDGLLLRGRIREASQDLPGAETAYRRAASVAPADDRAVLGLASVLDRRGRIDDARRVLRRGADRAPQSTAALVALAKLERSAKHLDRALEALGRARARDPEDLDLAIGLADIHERQLQYEEAARILAEHVEAHPNLARALLEAARAELRLDREDRARRLLERLEAIEADRDLDREIGLMLASEGRTVLALERLEAHVRGHPADEDARWAMAIALADAGRAGAALSELERFGPESQRYEAARTAAAEILLERGDLDRAELALRHGMEKRPSSPAIVGLLAEVLERRGDVDGAVILLRETPGTASERMRLAAIEARILARHGRRDEAFRLMTAVTDDQDAEARFLHASFLWDMEDERALDALAKVVRSSGDARSLTSFALAEATRGKNLEEAEALLRRALIDEPRSPDVMSALGFVLFGRGRLEAAEVVLARAARLAPRDPRIGERLGDVMRARGNRTAARKVYLEAMDLLRRRLLAKDPGASGSKERIARKLEDLGG
jgi:tetratricopeptide (TPR) repeat protein